MWTMEDRKRVLAAWEDLLQSTVPRTHKQGFTLFCQGDSVSEVLLLKQGLVKLNHTLPCGRETLIGIRLPGQFVEWAPHCSGAHAVTATAVTELRVYHIRADHFHREVSRHSSALQLLSEVMRLDLYEALAALIEFKTLPTSDRLILLFSRMAEAQGIPKVGGPVRIHLPLKDHELAALLGISKENFSRMRRKLEKQRRIARVDQHVVIISTMPGKATPLDLGDSNANSFCLSALPKISCRKAITTAE